MESIRKLLPVLVAVLILAMSGVANAGPVGRMIQNGHERRVERRQDGRGVARLVVVGRAAGRVVTAPARWIGGGRGSCAGGSCR